MTKIVIFLLLILGVSLILGHPLPGGNKHVKYRIHVPQKVHTVFVTKVVKVPEHHHHHHEVKKEEHHHHHKEYKEPEYKYKEPEYKYEPEHVNSHKYFESPKYYEPPKYGWKGDNYDSYQ